MLIKIDRRIGTMSHAQRTLWEKPFKGRRKVSKKAYKNAEASETAPYKILLLKLILPNINLTGINAIFLSEIVPSRFHQADPCTENPPESWLKNVGSQAINIIKSGMWARANFFQSLYPRSQKTGIIRRET